jgi:SCF-associated factor 1
VLLNSLGQLFATGVLNGLRFQRPSPAVKTLRFSPQFRPTSKDRYNPSTAIWQYSVGRSHILGLSDSGRVWEWSDFALPAMCVKSISVDMVVGGPINGPGRVTRVVAGT